jgi:putative transposase
VTRRRRIADRDRIFFVTSNLRAHLPALRDTERDLILKQLARQRAADEFLLFAYVIMPSHVHLLIAPKAAGLIAVMREFKSCTGIELAKARGSRRAIWQPRYFDFVLRRVGDFWDKLEYIHQNPVEAGWRKTRNPGCGRARHIILGPCLFRFRLIRLTCL